MISLFTGKSSSCYKIIINKWLDLPHLMQHFELRSTNKFDRNLIITSLIKMQITMNLGERLPIRIHRIITCIFIEKYQSTQSTMRLNCNKDYATAYIVPYNEQ